MEAMQGDGCEFLPQGIESSQLVSPTGQLVAGKALQGSLTRGLQVWRHHGLWDWTLVPRPAELQFPDLEHGCAHAYLSWPWDNL